MATARNPSSKAKTVVVKQVLNRLDKVHPDAKLDLDFTNPLELLIALILAAQARDDLVNQVTVPLFKNYRTAEDYARSSSGTPRTNRRSILPQQGQVDRNCCMKLARHGGKLPDRLDDLVSLPVGKPPTSFQQRLRPASDRRRHHVMRLSQRLGLITPIPTRSGDLTSIVRKATGPLLPPTSISAGVCL
jgi:endonuclease-3